MPYTCMIVWRRQKASHVVSGLVCKVVYQLKNSRKSLNCHIFSKFTYISTTLSADLLLLFCMCSYFCKVRVMSFLNLPDFLRLQENVPHYGVQWGIINYFVVAFFLRDLHEFFICFFVMLMPMRARCVSVCACVLCCVRMKSATKVIRAADWHTAEQG